MALVALSPPPRIHGVKIIPSPDGTPAAAPARRPALRQRPGARDSLAPSQSATTGAKSASEANQLDIFGNARDIERISRHLDNGNLGAAIDCFMALVSVVFAGTYVANTYIPYNDLAGY
ncbi:hypothetical protein ON010_g4923 [Phytophthora cinnamomi]|nr:hypothetical protein ON010_g4923 [Phytophthora cinnamomi]